MRYHWIQDRVAQGHFQVVWRRGDQNLADFFTKALPVHTHQTLMRLLVHTPPSPATSSQTAKARRAVRWSQTQHKQIERVCWCMLDTRMHHPQYSDKQSAFSHQPKSCLHNLVFTTMKHSRTISMVRYSSDNGHATRLRMVRIDSNDQLLSLRCHNLNEPNWITSFDSRQLIPDQQFV